MVGAAGGVSIPCRGCGRAYEAARFEGGRTIWCACGRRVGRRLEAPEACADRPPRFLADAMLGRLARWLRLLGLDCAWDPDGTDEALVRRGLDEARIVLTRDRGLPEAWWVSNVYVVESEAWPEALGEVVRRFDLAREIAPFSRCADCNRPVVPLSSEEVAARVPPGVLATQTRFTGCPDCGRVFWPGSHADRIRNFVDERIAPLRGHG